MAISRNSSTAGTDNSSSYNVTIAGSIVIMFVMYSDDKTLTAVTLAGVSGTILQAPGTDQGYNTAAVSFKGTFTGSQAVVLTYTGGNPTSSRSVFLGYNGSRLVDVSGSLTDTSGTVTATVVGSNCWVIGFVACDTSSATRPTTGTNNDGYYATTGTSNGLMRWTIGDSNGTVAAGSQSVITSTTGGQNYTKTIIALGVSTDYTMVAAQSSFTLTGFAATLSQGIHYVMSAAQAAFSLTGQAVALTLRLYTRYTNQTLNSITPTNVSKSSAISPTNATKNTITPTNQAKS